MVRLYDVSRPFPYVGDDSLGILVPCPIDQFELVWVDPPFESILILFFMVSVNGCDGVYEQCIW